MNNYSFYIGLSLTCSGVVMLFTYFVVNELLKELTGVVDFWCLHPFLAVIAVVVITIGLSIFLYYDHKSKWTSN